MEDVSVQNATLREMQRVASADDRSNEELTNRKP